MGIGGTWDGRLLSRRRFLGAAGGLAGLLAVGSLPPEKAIAAPRFSDYPFKLGVASGDPRPDSVVLWTRLAPEPLLEDGSGGVPPERYDVRWEVAADEGFRKVVRRGSAEAGPAQERWLKEGLARSRKGWNVVAQQTMLAEYDFSAVADDLPNGQLFNMDQWDGYVAARRRLLGFLDRARVRNPITLTGDIH